MLNIAICRNQCIITYTDNREAEIEGILLMKHFKTLVLLILTVLLVAGVLCGCAVQTGEQPGISSLPHITIGSDIYPPFVYLDNNGDPTGIDVEIAVEAFRRMGYQAVFTTIDWE